MNIFHYKFYRNSGLRYAAQFPKIPHSSAFINFNIPLDKFRLIIENLKKKNKNKINRQVENKKYKKVHYSRRNCEIIAVGQIFVRDTCQ